jgi:hypothetical protein
MFREYWRYALIGGIAIVMGVLLDRALVGHGGPAGSSNVVAQLQVETPPKATAASRSTRLRSSTVSEVAPPATAKPPIKDLATILAEHDRRQRMSDLEAFINNLAPGDYGNALKGIRRMPSTNERDLASRLLVARWVQTDPEAALNFAAANRGYEYIADDVFQTEAASDLTTALDRARAITNPDLRYQALLGVLSFMADSNPAGALQLAQGLGDFPGNEPLSNVIYRQWATNDPQGAALAAMQAGGDGWRSPILQVARTWASEDPLAAANWSIGLTDSQAQMRSISQVMRQWTREDVSAAANWVNSLPPGSSYDAAAAGLAASLAANHPQDAISWAQNIADPTMRTDALQRVSREVMWRNPTNGAEILQAAGVPANLIPQPGADGRRPRGGG